MDDDPDNPGDRHRPPGDPRSSRTTAQKEANRLVSRERTANEPGFADLKEWRILTQVRMNAGHATTLLRVRTAPKVNSHAPDVKDFSRLLPSQ
ncbi:hypothetical protein ACFC0R_27600 [Streptomyces sp. NPDC056086]|uniref:hypothetical protein n=1 Tax=Streptomyces sp. NPDC056086 TaxID=3345709 RepID=UPI0035DDCCA4